ncbi:uncharacterized protein LOC123561831 [Mercenaria mercenaria]|uniref:uncharacterized protein LOC123561831 n=1 Tax=Mercenaria mercenaria TaxID=6596 RepID=UPI00234ECAC4|nr:uncharacterized protein LOC123561831 [Mercenaria mercenaria]XP_045210383.2 uncharacterized protein LOC123561831 [Mercenaria mercenaria]
MAVGGRKAPAFAVSPEQGCDFLYDYTCSPCISDGKNKEAIKFCVDCGEYLCENCLIDHNRFAKMKSHRLVDPERYDHGRISPKDSCVPTITIYCDKHHGEVLDMFCGEHDEVCCTICLELEHSHCKDRVYIPDISKDIQKTEEFKQQQKENKNILSNLESIKQKRRRDLALYRTQKDAIFKHFKQVREDIIKEFDELEERSVELVESRFQQNVSTVSAVVEEIDEMYDVMKSNDDTLKNEKDAAQAFVLLKTGKKHVANTRALMQRLQSTRVLPFDFKMNEQVNNCFAGVKSLGSFHSGSVSSKVFGVQDKSEKYRCNVKSFCQLEDGCLIIVDAANENIKRLGSTYTVIEKCIMPSQPWSVCTFKNTEIAVSLCNERSIQFITVKGKMQLSRSFKVKDTCTGLASSGETLFVGPCNRNQIQVYSQYGRLLTTIDFAIGSTQYTPWCIAISPDNAFLHVASRKDGVISVDTERHKCEKLNIPELRFASSIAVAQNGGLYVSCEESNKIFHYIDGRCETLLTEADGISSPKALFCYRQQDLIVASKDMNGIRVYSQVNKLLQ